MQTDEILGRSLLRHRQALDAGEYSSVELTRTYLERIGRIDAEIGSFLALDEEGALRAAHESDLRRAKGERRGTLDGIPYAIKDNFCTRRMSTTCASRMLQDWIAPYDAAVVERLERAGAILLGKLNMDEFAMGSSGEHSAYRLLRNPHDTTRVTGGSSGGSAAAVAACEVPFSIGSDTGGSVRQPAAFCGVLGLKPTYGVISRYGMVALASSLDCVGILTQNAKDAVEVLSAVSGRDVRDATSRDLDLTAYAPTSLRGLRVATVREMTQGQAVSGDVRDALRCAEQMLLEQGATVEAVSLPTPENALAAYCVLSAAEISSNMARFDGIRFGVGCREATDLFSQYADSRAAGFGDEVKRRILLGTYLLTEENRRLYYESAKRAASMIRTRMCEILSRYDLILSPVSPTTAPRHGEIQSPAQKRRADLCSVYANLAGVPAVSVPFGKDTQGMPLAIQLTGAPFSEAKLLAVAGQLQSLSEGGAL